ncbi:hypothetical protein JKP88DRAFT_320330 [Tribonema minus]|uniref:Uncharacterized protein n=1 Tax=Tribonema minus TaxID=303371 RepID=A0A835Z2R9_9STRA|nr:hypothetical protein JKP88DRAFT_320330 [Tribonema minus]
MRFARKPALSLTLAPRSSSGSDGFSSFGPADSRLWTVLQSRDCALLVCAAAERESLGRDVDVRIDVVVSPAPSTCDSGSCHGFRFTYCALGACTLTADRLQPLGGGAFLLVITTADSVRLLEIEHSAQRGRLAVLGDSDVAGSAAEVDGAAAAAAAAEADATGALCSPPASLAAAAVAAPRTPCNHSATAFARLSESPSTLSACGAAAARAACLSASAAAAPAAATAAAAAARTCSGAAHRSALHGSPQRPLARSPSASTPKRTLSVPAALSTQINGACSPHANGGSARRDSCPQTSPQAPSPSAGAAVTAAAAAIRTYAGARNRMIRASPPPPRGETAAPEPHPLAPRRLQALQTSSSSSGSNDSSNTSLPSSPAAQPEEALPVIKASSRWWDSLPPLETEDADGAVAGRSEEAAAALGDARQGLSGRKAAVLRAQHSLDIEPLLAELLAVTPGVGAQGDGGAPAARVRDYEVQFVTTGGGAGGGGAAVTVCVVLLDTASNTLGYVLRCDWRSGDLAVTRILRQQQQQQHDAAQLQQRQRRSPDARAPPPPPPQQQQQRRQQPRSLRELCTGLAESVTLQQQQQQGSAKRGQRFSPATGTHCLDNRAVIRGQSLAVIDNPALPISLVFDTARAGEQHLPR